MMPINKHLNKQYELVFGNIEISEFNDGEWIGGCYATYDNLVEKVKEALSGSNN